MKDMERLQLNDFCKKQHQDVIDKGFTNFEVPHLLMLIVSELSEAMEADWKDKHSKYQAFEYALKGIQNSPESREDRERMYMRYFELLVKDTFEDEIADAFLRLMDLCGAYNIDIEKAIRYKKEYNRLRPIKHGKAY